MRRTKPLTEFERGYLIAVANLYNLHREEAIACDVARELNVSWSQIRKAAFCDYDMEALRIIRRGPNGDPFE